MTINRRKLLKSSSAIASAYLLGGCASQYGSQTSYLSKNISPNNSNIVYEWMDISFQSVRDQSIEPPRAARALSLGPVAGFLAVNGITKKYVSHYSLGDAPLGANPEVAYGVAFSIAAAEAFQQPFVFDRMRFLKKFENNDAKQKGIEWGEKVGNYIAKLRTGDGNEPSKRDFYLGRFPRRDDILKWRPTGSFYNAHGTSPGFNSFQRGLFPGFGAIKPWTMTSSSQFRSDNFLDPTSQEFSQQIEYIAEIGGSNSKTRTVDQSEIALFWEDGPWGITPPGHFILIAMQVMQDKPMELDERARMLALLAMTQCDAAICAWDTKYHHDIVRPETVIRHLAHNIDSKLSNKPKWNSYIPTPNFPAYVSGHSVFGSAGTHLTSLFHGGDDISLTAESPDQVLWPSLQGVSRHWTKLSQINEENGMSRIYGGVHWDLDNIEGIKCGKQIAEQAFNTLFPKVV